MKEGFFYQPDSDVFKCRKGKYLTFSKLIHKKGIGYYRLYSIKAGLCKNCKHWNECRATNGSLRINAGPYYPSYYANRVRYETPTYIQVKRLRGIWSEGTFATLKNYHNLKRHRKRGLNCATEECLLSATALNLKRFVKAVGT